MFTGLVEAVGTVRALRKHSRGALLTVESGIEGLRPGESISVNGVCQTITGIAGSAFSCDVLSETLRVSNFSFLRSGSRVNLERAILATARLGGHIVNGHVDGLGAVTSITKKPLSVAVSVEPALLKYLVPKGPVAVNGMSLTVGPDVRNGRFTVFLIPHTWESTNFKDLKIGSKVNIEVDILAKYVERFLLSKKGSEIS